MPRLKINSIGLGPDFNIVSYNPRSLKTKLSKDPKKMRGSRFKIEQKCDHESNCDIFIIN